MMRRAALATCLAGVMVAAGTGTAGAATLAPTSANFGTQAVGTASAPKVFTLTPELLDLTLAISTTGDFKQSNNCPAQLGILSGPCTINVTFAPTAGGGRSGTLNTTTPLLGGPTAALSGTGDATGSNTGNNPGANKCAKKGKKKGKKGKKRAAASKKKKGKKGKKCKKGKKKSGKGKKK